jgi:hypothetical protein
MNRTTSLPEPQEGCELAKFSRIAIPGSEPGLWSPKPAMADLADCGADRGFAPE